jgi:hypothetical protein
LNRLFVNVLAGQQIFGEDSQLQIRCKPTLRYLLDILLHFAQVLILALLRRWHSHRHFRFVSRPIIILL